MITQQAFQDNQDLLKTIREDCACFKHSYFLTGISNPIDILLTEKRSTCFVADAPFEVLSAITAPPHFSGFSITEHGSYVNGRGFIVYSPAEFEVYLRTMLGYFKLGHDDNNKIISYDTELAQKHVQGRVIQFHMDFFKSGVTSE